MTIEVTNPVAGPYTPNGVTTDFPFAFKIMSTNEIRVVDASENVIDLGYSVTIAASGEGGTVSFANPVPSDIGEFYIQADPAFGQPTLYGATTTFNPGSLNNPTDRLAAQNIILKNLSDRGIRYPIGETTQIMPSAADRAGKFFAHDADGKLIMSSGTGADAGLRTDLAAETGSTLIKASDGNTVQENLDHGGKTTPTGTGATTRNTADVLLALGKQAKSYGAAEDGVTDDRTNIANLLTAAAGGIALMPGTYLTSAGAANSNPAESDPDPSAFYVTQSGSVVDGLGLGKITCNGANKGIFHVRNSVEANRPKNIIVRNFRGLVQAYGNPEAGGLQDDYFVFRSEGAYDCVFEDLQIEQCELGFTDEFVQTSVYCNYYTFDASADVSTANDTITINKDLAGGATTHDFVTGSQVAMNPGGTATWSATGATMPGGIVAPYRYYVIVVDSTTIKLAASFDDAIAGTAVDLTAAGSGTVAIIRMDRGSKRNILDGFTIAKCAYIGVQLGGCEYGSYSSLSISGQDSDGTSRGAPHAFRADGFWQALTRFNYLSGSAYRMANGLSLQSWSENNSFEVIANDCVNGVQTTTPTDAIAAAKHNEITITADRCDYGVYEGGNSYNTYIVDILNPNIRGINATNGGGVTGLAESNIYRGRIRRTLAGSTVRLFQNDASNTKVDLDLEGSGSTSSDTAFGFNSTGVGVTGALRIKNCLIGAQFSGSGGKVNVKSSGCGTDIVVAATASNLTIDCDCDGNVIINSGASNITLTGQVRGTLTDNGTGTDLSRLNPKNGTTTQTTDASGFVTITHGLGRIPKVVNIASTDNAFRVFTVTARTTTTFTVRAWTGNAAPLASTSVGFQWSAF